MESVSGVAWHRQAPVCAFEAVSAISWVVLRIRRKLSIVCVQCHLIVSLPCRRPRSRRISNLDGWALAVGQSVFLPEDTREGYADAGDAGTAKREPGGRT